jgi:hypothetical protein
MDAVANSMNGSKAKSWTEVMVLGIVISFAIHISYLPHCIAYFQLRASYWIPALL